MKSLAVFISYLFHPLFLPLYLTGIFFRISPVAYHDTFQLYLFLIVALGAVIIPLSSIGIMRITGAVSSFHLPIAKERRWPFVLFSVTMYVTKLLIDQIQIQTPIQAALLAAALSLIICSLALEKIKISIHSLGMGGFSSYIIWEYMQFNVQSILAVCLAILISGLVGWSRLTLKAHKETEVFIGWILGFGIFLASFYLLSLS